MAKKTKKAEQLDGLTLIKELKAGWHLNQTIRVSVLEDAEMDKKVVIYGENMKDGKDHVFSVVEKDSLKGGGFMLRLAPETKPAVVGKDIPVGSILPYVE